MKPLSVFSYLKRSMSKVLPMVITVCLAVGMLYFLSLFLSKMNQQILEINAYPLKHMSFISGGKKGISNDQFRKLRDNSGGMKVFAIDMCDVTYHIIMGSTGASVLKLKQKDITDVMKIEQFKLSEGRLPEKSSEIILHKKLAANYGLKVGSVIGKHKKGWYIDSDLRVVGLFTGKGITGIVMEEDNMLKPGAPYVSVAIGGDNLKTANKYIDKNFSSEYETYTLSAVNSFLDNFNGPINAMKLFLGAVLVGVICIFLVNITNIQYSIRRKELELLYAIGYSKKYIVGKAFGEIGIAAMMGYVLGIMLSILMTWVLNICFLSDKCLDMPLISPGGIINMLLVPLAITLFSMIAPLRVIRFRDIV